MLTVKLHSKDYRTITKKIIFFVMPFVILFLILFSLYEKSLIQQTSLLVLTEQEKGNAVIANQLEATFSQFVSDLLTVFDSAYFNRYIQDTTPNNLDDLEQLFLRIANKKPYITHIRLLDATGMEILKVNHYPEAPAFPADPDALQDRSDTQFFLYDHSNGMDTLYISPIGLESRQDLHDGHQGPALVLAMPVYHDGEFFGLVIVDYDACFLLSFLQEYQSSITKNINFGLVDNKGVWLQRDRVLCSEFLEKATGATSLFDETPQLEHVIFSKDSGSHAVADNIYSFQTVKPKAHQKLSWYPDEGRMWTVVSHYPLAELSALTLNPILLHPASRWWLVTILFLLGVLFVVIIHLRAIDQLQLQISSIISEYSGNGIVVIDENNRITFCNHAFEVLSGYSQMELVGKETNKFLPCADLSRLPKDATKSNAPTNMPIWIRHKNGHQYLTNRIRTRVKTEMRKSAFTVEVYTSSSWKVSAFVSYVSKNQIDLPEALLAGYGIKSKTSYCLLIQLKHQLERDFHYSLVTESNFSLSLSLFIASELAQSEPVYVFSADSYVVLLHEDDSSKVQERIQNLLLGVEKQCSSLSKFVQNQAMCGYSQYSGGEVSIPTLLVQASMATKIVGDSKKGKSLLFSTEVHDKYFRQQAILAAIPEAFNSFALKLYYQAQLDVASGRILGAEALIRWIHPELGFVAPNEFIPLMEEHHLVWMLGEFVIRAAVAFLKTNQEFLQSVEPNFSLSINLSAEEFSNQAIIDLIGDELQTHGVDPSLLTVELTERTAVESLQSTEQLINLFHKIGVGISIDDFGTGFSSLSYLLELSFDKIKIDRSFIANYPDSAAITIYKTVLLLAKELGTTVLAEGVETEEQLGFLKQIGCNEYQGYLFSQAVPEDEFLEQLKGQRK